MKGLTPQQSHDYSEATYWIKRMTQAPALALKKICNAPGFRKFLIKLVEADLSMMAKHHAALGKELTKQRHLQREPKASKQVEDVLRPVFGGISKKARVDHAAKATYLEGKLQLLPAMFAMFGNVDSRSDQEVDEVMIDSARVQEVSGSQLVRYTGNEEASGTLVLKQMKIGAKGKIVNKVANIDDDDEHEVANEEVDIARKDYIAYHAEQEIVHGTVQALEKMKLYYQDLLWDPHMYRKFNTELEAVFSAGTKLSFDLIKDQILEFAGRTSKLRTQIPAVAWNLNDPISIYNAIEHAMAQSDDAKINQAYGQMQLYTSINRLVAKGRRSAQKFKKDADRHQLAQLDFLDEYADKKVGNAASLAVKKAMRSKFRDEYYSGENWLDMANLFGGTGVVFVFAMASKLPTTHPPNLHLPDPPYTYSPGAEIGFHYVARAYSQFQRDCFKYLAERLPSIRRLVTQIGPRALEEYCCRGSLSGECIASIELATSLLVALPVGVGGDEDENEIEDEIEDDDE